ncbi:MAG: hypothetical protein HC906_13585 [Bacteroidales bacterium]|nr:hypothetical protein [Bacteroidales bacterium]
MIRWKIYFDRSRMYIGYIQFFLIGIVFLQSLKGNAWKAVIVNYAYITIPAALILFIIFSLVVGYLDTKLGFREEELRNLSKSNPMMVEILESMQEINNRLKSIESDLNKESIQ